MNRKITVTGLSALIATLIFSQSLSAEILIQDDFSRNGLLANTQPAPVNVTGNVWQIVTEDNTNASWTTNGSSLNYSVRAVGTRSRNSTASLGFTPIEAMVYKLSATVTLTEGEWVALGFGGDASGVYGQGSNYLMLNSAGSVVAYRTPRAGEQLGSVLAASNTVELSIELDTSTMIATYYMNGNSFTTGAVSSLSGVDHVFLDVRSSRGVLNTGSIDNFMLSVTPIPEKSTISLLMLGGVAMALGLRQLRRRKV